MSVTPRFAALITLTCAGLAACAAPVTPEAELTLGSTSVVRSSQPPATERPVLPTPSPPTPPATSTSTTLPTGSASQVKTLVDGQTRLPAVSTAEHLTNLGGVGFGLDGNVLFTDASLGRIFRVNPDTGALSLFSGIGAGNPGNAVTLKDGSLLEAQFNQPGDVLVASDGTVYVADRGNGAIRRISKTGLVETIAGGPTGDPKSIEGLGRDIGFTQLGGIVLDPVRGLFVGDRTSIRLVDLTKPGHPVSLIAGGTARATPQPGDTGFKRPLPVDGPGRSAVLGDITGLAIDGKGGIIFADAYHAAIRRVDLTAGGLPVKTLARGDTNPPLTSSKEYWSKPVGVAVAPSGLILFTDAQASGSIYQLTSIGEVSIWAGGRLTLSVLEGRADAVRFNHPGALVVAPDGRVFTAETRGARVVRIQK